MKSALLVEKAKLENCEFTIAKSQEGFVAVGRALAMIRDERLYKLAGFSTFEDYCQRKWSFTKTRANQLIQWNQVDDSLTTTVVKPASEWQARELAKVEPEAREETWAAAQVEFETPQPTAAEIRAVRETRQSPSKPTEIDCADEDREQRLFDAIEKAIKACRAIDDDVNDLKYRKIVERVLANRSFLTCFQKGR